jgi:hypothetical protein
MRHATDAIHSAISRKTNALQKGGYSRALHLAEKSISRILDKEDNTALLLHLHAHLENHFVAQPETVPQPTTFEASVCALPCVSARGGYSNSMAPPAEKERNFQRLRPIGIARL